jgi:NAD+ synthetase
VFSQAKSLLPSYDVFDECRYFEPASEIHLWSCDGQQVAIGICEDLWGELLEKDWLLYSKKPIETYRKLGATLLLSLSASPYEHDKRVRRENLHSEIARDLGIPLVYVNQVGATDEILFDGGSFAVNSMGEVLGRLPFFKKSWGLIDIFSEKEKFVFPSAQEREDTPPTDLEVLCRGLVIGIQDYFKKTGFKTAVIGLSGGIDSAVVATLAVRALGAENVLGVAMPSQFSSSHSLADAEALAKSLGCRFEVKPIKFLYSTASRELSEGRGGLTELAKENLQARLRGMILMALSNHYSSLVLSTGNKSELAMGYCTLYGDMVGALAPIGDLYKTQVYELAHEMNRLWNHPIPARSITKAPSAELRPNQTDQDTLPPYDILDMLLYHYLEKAESISSLKERFSSQLIDRPDWVSETLRQVVINEYKRRQAAPILKVSSKAFGIGRRFPVAKRLENIE